MTVSRRFLGRRTIQLTTLLLAGATLAGCATMAGGSPEEQVKARAKARWEAVMKGDFERAYGYLTPSYRSLVPFKNYAGAFGTGVQLFSADVENVTCQPDKCTAVVAVKNKPIALIHVREPFTTQVQEVWLREQGQWWLFQKD